MKVAPVIDLRRRFDIRYVYRPSAPQSARYLCVDRVTKIGAVGAEPSDALLAMLDALARRVVA